MNDCQNAHGMSENENDGGRETQKNVNVSEREASSTGSVKPQLVS